MFKKDELAAWPQDTSDTSNGLHDAGDRAQGKGANNRIDRTVLQRDAFTWKVYELNSQLRLLPMLSARRIMPGLGSNA